MDESEVQNIKDCYENETYLIKINAQIVASKMVMTTYDE